MSVVSDSCNPIDYTVHGILQAKTVEWVAVPFSRESSQPRSPTLQADSLPAKPPGKLRNTGVGSLYFFQQIFLTQELNLVLLYCRWLCRLSYQRTSANNINVFFIKCALSPQTASNVTTKQSSLKANMKARLLRWLLFCPQILQELTFFFLMPWNFYDSLVFSVAPFSECFEYTIAC